MNTETLWNAFQAWGVENYSRGAHWAYECTERYEFDELVAEGKFTDEPSMVAYWTEACSLTNEQYLNTIHGSCGNHPCRWIDLRRLAVHRIRWPDTGLRRAEHS